MKWNGQKETLIICRAFKMSNRVRNPNIFHDTGNDFDVAFNELVKNLWGLEGAPHIAEAHGIFYIWQI